jgi:hypothetical protein
MRKLSKRKPPEPAEDSKEEFCDDDNAFIKPSLLRAYPKNRHAFSLRNSFYSCAS